MSKHPIKDTVENARDATSEASHRTTAEMERLRREALGDELTPAEKIASGAKEAANRVQAETDKIKRKVRSRK